MGKSHPPPVDELGQEVLRSFLQECSAQFRKIPAFTEAGAAITAIVGPCPRNGSFGEVYAKVALINLMWGTNVYDTRRLARHIQSQGQNIDRLLVAGDPKVIEAIRYGHGIRTKTGAERDFYSFAAKYAHWHNPMCYPPYDSFGDFSLVGLQRQFPFASLRSGDLISYVTLKRTIDKLKRYTGWSSPGYKEIDEGLWICGKCASDDTAQNIPQDVKTYIREIGQQLSVELIGREPRRSYYSLGNRSVVTEVAASHRSIGD
ncbi:MAG TPA: hypothetical protein VFJ58_14060 [Armatimonadota bacterium]|nr:hypothetical protein [Armatimonadota bacterium]